MYALSFAGILIGWFIAIPGAYLIAANALHPLEHEPVHILAARQHLTSKPHPNVVISNFRVSINGSYEIIRRGTYTYERTMYYMLGPDKSGISPKDTALIVGISGDPSEERIAEILQQAELPGHLARGRPNLLHTWLEKKWPEVTWENVPTLSYGTSSMHWGYSIPQFCAGLFLVLISTTVMYHHVYKISAYYDENPSELQAYGYLTFNVASWLGRQPPGVVETLGNCLVGFALFGAVVMGGVISVVSYKWWTTENGISMAFLLGAVSCILTMALALGFAVLTKGSRVNPSDEAEFAG